MLTRDALSKLRNVFIAGPAMMLGSCSRAQPQREVTPPVETRISLAPYGLPTGFFKPYADTKCGGQIIGYRFVVWLNDEDVAVGFNTSPNCRQSSNRKVDGMARLLVFSTKGSLIARSDIPYLADGYGEIVADGEAGPGPDGTLLFRLQSVNLDQQGKNESKSGTILFDSSLKETARIDQLLEQSTFVDHALVFQEGFTLTGPRTYSVLDGAPPKQIEHWIQDWPTGTLDRIFGEHSIAYMLCQQELAPNAYTSSNIIYSGVKRRCKMVVQARDRTTWSFSMKDGETAAIIGILRDGSVAAQVNVKDNPAGRLVLWRKDQAEETLPWISKDTNGSVGSSTGDMTRYSVFTTKESKRCLELDEGCSDNGRWLVFDRKLQGLLIDRTLVKNARASLAPNGMHYASFESGELRIYPLPKP